MAKMWSGRTDGVTDKIADDFNSSIGFDCRMYKQDIKGSIAHAMMLGAQGIISAADVDAIIGGLTEIEADITSGKLAIDYGCEDIHMFVEQVLTERIGDAGKRLHTARSRNDQVALDLRMYLLDEITEIKAGITSSAIFESRAPCFSAFSALGFLMQREDSKGTIRFAPSSTDF